MLVEGTIDGLKMSPQCSSVGVLSALLREPDLPQAAQAGGSEGSGVSWENTLLLPGVNAHCGLGPTAHTLTLPSLLSCEGLTSSPSYLTAYLSAAGLWVTSCIYRCTLGEGYTLSSGLFKWETIGQASVPLSLSLLPTPVSHPCAFKQQLNINPLTGHEGLPVVVVAWGVGKAKLCSLGRMRQVSC